MSQADAGCRPPANRGGGTGERNRLGCEALRRVPPARSPRAAAMRPRPFREQMRHPRYQDENSKKARIMRFSTPLSAILVLGATIGAVITAAAQAPGTAY